MSSNYSQFDESIGQYNDSVKKYSKDYPDDVGGRITNDYLKPMGAQLTGFGTICSDALLKFGKVMADFKERFKVLNNEDRSIMTDDFSVAKPEFKGDEMSFINDSTTLDDDMEEAIFGTSIQEFGKIGEYIAEFNFCIDMKLRYYNAMSYFLPSECIKWPTPQRFDYHKDELKREIDALYALATLIDFNTKFLNQWSASENKINHHKVRYNNKISRKLKKFIHELSSKKIRQQEISTRIGTWLKSTKLLSDFAFEEESLRDLITTISSDLRKCQPPISKLSHSNINISKTFPPCIVSGKYIYTSKIKEVKNIHVPALYSFPFDYPMLLSSIDEILFLILRVSYALPLGFLEITAIDHAASGENVRLVNGLQAVKGLLKIVTKTDAIVSVLKEYETYLGDLVDKGVFSHDISNWEEYNKRNRKSPLPYKILVLFSLDGFDRLSDAFGILGRLLKNGPSRGLHVIMHEKCFKNIDPRNFDRFKDMAWLKTPPWTNCSNLTAVFHQDSFPSVQETGKIINEIVKIAEERSIRPALSVTSLLNVGSFWNTPSSEGIEIPLGRDERDNLVPLRIGFSEDALYHVLLGGATGSGKSNLLHVLIHSLCNRYSPDELNLYLLDYKDGLEFQKYTSGNNVWLPHVKTISTHNDPEYALTMFDYLKEERKRRKQLYKGLGDFVAFRRNGGQLPRIIVIIDEFHKLFEGDNADKIVDEMVDILKQGRAYGIHLILATQTLASLHVKGLAGMLGQIPIRFALHGNGDEGILDPNNNGSTHIKIPQCILNVQFGKAGRNVVFSLPYVDHQAQEALAFRKQIASHVDVQKISTHGRIFDGTRLPMIPDQETFNTVLASDAPLGYVFSLLLGVKNNFTASNFFVSFDDSPTSNLLIAGADGALDDEGLITGAEISKGLRTSIISSLMAVPSSSLLYYNPTIREIPPELNGVEVCTGTTTEEELHGSLHRLAQNIKSDKRVLIVDNYDRARLLHPQADNSRFSLGQSAKTPETETARSLFLKAFSDSEQRPFFVILFVRNFDHTRRNVLQKHGAMNLLQYCSLRIGYNLNESDWTELIPKARRIKLNKRVVFDDINASEQPVFFLPYENMGTSERLTD